MNEVLVTTGQLYPATARTSTILGVTRKKGVKPVLVVETQGGTAVVSEDDLRDDDPMLLNIIKAHLAGRWVMVMDVSRDNGEIAARDKAVLEHMPLAWGEHGRIMAKLGINRRELQRSLERLVKSGAIENPTRGRYCHL